MGSRKEEINLYRALCVCCARSDSLITQAGGGEGWRDIARSNILKAPLRDAPVMTEPAD